MRNSDQVYNGPDHSGTILGKLETKYIADVRNHLEKLWDVSGREKHVMRNNKSGFATAAKFTEDICSNERN